MWPGLDGERPSAGERKKFCMSIITSADLEGARVMGEVVVWMVILEEGEGAEWDAGCVRSNPVREECSQKFVLEPTKALRCGSWEIGGSEGEAMVVDRVLFVGLSF